MSKIKIVGFVPIGKHRDVNYFYSKKVNKFVFLENLVLSDLEPIKENVIPITKSDWPLIDDYLGVAKITIKIKI